MTQVRVAHIVAVGEVVRLDYLQRMGDEREVERSKRRRKWQKVDESKRMEDQEEDEMEMEKEV